MTDTTPLEHVGREVQRRRLELGMDPTTLARTAGVDTKTTRALEAGERWPRDMSRLKIEKALGWTAGSLDKVRAGGRATLVDEGAESAVDPEATGASIVDATRVARDQLVTLANGIRQASGELLALGDPRVQRVIDMLDELERTALLQAATAMSGPRLLHTAGTRLGAPSDEALERYAANEAAEREHHNG
ncbi:helix-turn-helix domain-containing protein [Nocardia niigatensis]